MDGKPSASRSDGMGAAMNSEPASDDGKACFAKRQQMQWSKRGAHLLLQTRVKTLNHELGAVFKRWYPDLEVEELAEAA